MNWGALATFKALQLIVQTPLPLATAHAAVSAI